jgi:Spy/CpxP family protein refolding chaperone
MTRRYSVATLALLSALPVLAQGRRPSGGATGRLDFLAGYLGLTESQREQAKTIFDAANSAAQTALGQLTSARDALQQAVKAGRSEAELDRLAAALGVIEGQLAGIHAKAEAKFYTLLTAEQKQKYDERGNRMGPRRR